MKILFFVALALMPFVTVVSAADIKDCGGIRSYKVAPYLALATELQALGKQAAVARLQKWAESHEYDEQVMILCRILFDPRPGMKFQRPLLGDPQLYGGTTMEDWLLEPVTLIDDIPFLVVFSYAIAGNGEESSPYVKYCISNADWTSRRYRVVGKREISGAFEKLLKSPVWKQPLSKWEMELIAKQIQ